MSFIHAAMMTNIRSYSGDEVLRVLGVEPPYSTHTHRYRVSSGWLPFETLGDDIAALAYTRLVPAHYLVVIVTRRDMAASQVGRTIGITPPLVWEHTGTNNSFDSEVRYMRRDPLRLGVIRCIAQPNRLLHVVEPPVDLDAPEPPRKRSRSPADSTGTIELLPPSGDRPPMLHLARPRRPLPADTTARPDGVELADRLLNDCAPMQSVAATQSQSTTPSGAHSTPTGNSNAPATVVRSDAKSRVVVYWGMDVNAAMDRAVKKARRRNVPFFVKDAPLASWDGYGGETACVLNGLTGHNDIRLDRLLTLLGRHETRVPLSCGRTAPLAVTDWYIVSPHNPTTWYLREGAAGYELLRRCTQKMREV